MPPAYVVKEVGAVSSFNPKVICVLVFCGSVVVRKIVLCKLKGVNGAMLVFVFVGGVGEAAYASSGKVGLAIAIADAKRS